MRYRNFRLFFFGQLISLIGTWMQSTAQQWLVYRLTGSVLSLGMVSFIGFVPVLALSLFMGVLVDRLPRRKLIFLTQSWFMVLAAVLAVLVLLDMVKYWHVLLLSFLLGFGNALDMPARQSFFVDLVGREDLMNAIALNSSVFNAARIVGPAIAGAVIAAIGEGAAFAVNSISYLAVLGGLLMMRLPPFTAPETGTSGIADLVEGLRYLVHDRTMLGLVVTIALFSVFGFPYLSLLPAFAKDVLGMGAEGFGALMSAQGIGAFIGAIGLTAVGDRFRKGRFLRISRVPFVIAVTGLALSRVPLISMIALVIAGFGLIAQLATTNTIIQILAPEPLRGRLVSAYTWAIGGFFPLGSLLISAIGERIGAPQAVLLGAVVCAFWIVANRLVFPTASTDI